MLPCNDLNPASIVRARPESEVVSCSLAGEAALLCLRHNAYYGLDAVGAYVWQLVRPGLSVSAIQNALLRRFEVDEARCQNDLRALLGSMLAADLITLHAPPDYDARAASGGGES